MIAPWFRACPDSQVLAACRRPLILPGENTMKRNTLLGVLLLCSCGCSTMNNTEAGALGGGLLGGAFGTLVGAAVGRPLAGAAIGAGVGTGVGALSGHAEDKR